MKISYLAGEEKVKNLWYFTTQSQKSLNEPYTVVNEEVRMEISM